MGDHSERVIVLEKTKSMTFKVLSLRLGTRVGILCLCCSLFGCATYVTPGGPAPLGVGSRSAGADPLTQGGFDRKPGATFPAHLIAARVQGAGYRSYSARGYGTGRYSVLNVRDIESEEDFKRILAWPKVAQLGALNRMLLPEKIDSLDDLRRSAAGLQADILVLYTIDTQFIDRNSSALVTSITLGFGPTSQILINSTASALFVDVRTGFIFGAAEASASKSAISSVWRSESAADETRQGAEKEAFQKLLSQLDSTWAGIVSRYSK